MRYLFFDTETTGLPRDYRAPATDVDNWPRMVQLAWLECDFHDGDMPKFVHGDVVSEMIRPGGEFEVPERAVAIHGITTERAERLGSYLNDVVGSFNNAVARANIIVAHNTDYDKKIVGAEASRLDWPWVRLAIEEKPSMCTMRASETYCGISKKDGGFGHKWPKLSELYMKLFGEEFEGAHDAANDVLACARCFFELKRLEVIG